MEADVILNSMADFAKIIQGPTTSLLFFTALIVVYSVFVYLFYRYLAKKNIIGLNLKQYNQFRSAGTAKVFGFLLYILEYILILPILTIFWFSILAIFLLILAKSISVPSIMLITAALIASVRITSHISEKLSQDLAKMLPFTLLALAITGENFFSISTFITRLADIPTVIADLPFFIIFIITIELILRLAELLKELFVFGDNINEKEEEE